jgi:hypothetical protein
METKNKNMGLDYSDQAIKTNLQNAVNEMKKIIEERGLVLEGDLNPIDGIELYHETKSSKKKLARKIHYFLKAKTRRKMNILLAFVFKRFLKDLKKAFVSISKEQQEIEKSREEFKKHLALMLAAKTQYKDLKKKYKEKGGIYEN